MGKYNCETCGKEFKQKTNYTKHNKSCVTASNVKETIDFEIIDENTLVKNVSNKKINV